MTHTPIPQLFERPINILVVGCGGNGSTIVGVLPHLHQVLLAFGHPGGLSVTLIDPDTVSESNCMRQPFCRTEIGFSKAVALGASDEYVLGTQLAGRAGKNRTA
jgi:tRNA A37 threonylcarbamoyladenosine dehydratase